MPAARLEGVGMIDEVVEANRGDEALMTGPEVAKFLRVHLTSVRRWSRSGALRAFKIGKRGDWRYRKEDVKAFLYGSR